MSPKIAISRADYAGVAVKRGAFDDIDSDVVGHAETEDELIELGEGVDALPDVRVVSRYGIGVDNVDVEAATERGVPVTNVPSYCEEVIAAHALSLLLTAARKTAQYAAVVK